MVVADGNLPPDGFAKVAQLCGRANVPLVFEPTSVAKCSVPFLAKARIISSSTTQQFHDAQGMKCALNGVECMA